MNHVNEDQCLGRVSGTVGKRWSWSFDDFTKLGCPTSSLPLGSGEKRTLVLFKTLLFLADEMCS